MQLSLMSSYPTSGIPVSDRKSNDFPRTITGHDVVDLVLVMDEIAGEMKEIEKQTVI